MISDIESLLIYAGVHKTHHGLFRMPAKRFPYAVYYTDDSSTVIVVAVLPMRRQPSWIAETLRQRDESDG